MSGRKRPPSSAVSMQKQAIDASVTLIDSTLEGSCQCGGVEFTVDSNTPVPYQLCACSICRKIGGYTGCVNLGAINKTLNIKKGKDLIKYVKSPVQRYTYITKP